MSFLKMISFNHMLIKNAIDHHAPPKSKRTVERPLPFLNSQLRKACHRKSMLRKKYFKCGRTQLLWEQYRKSRNLVTKLKAKSMADYFSQRCSAQHLKRNPWKFWDTIKPFMTNKSKSCNENITLKHNGKIGNNPNDVCDIFNDHFTRWMWLSKLEVKKVWMKMKKSIRYLKCIKMMQVL